MSLTIVRATLTPNPISAKLQADFAATGSLSLLTK